MKLPSFNNLTGIPVPKLLEVNFMGDWKAVKTVLVHQHGAEDGQRLYSQWAEDMLLVLATGGDLTEHPRLRRLNFIRR